MSSVRIKEPIKKIPNKSFERKYYITFLLLFFIVVFVQIKLLPKMFSNDVTFAEDEMVRESIAVTSQISQGEEVLQWFVVPKDNLKEVSFKIASYGEQLSGNVHIRVGTADKQVMYDEDLDVSQWQDNTFVSVVFAIQEHSAGQKYFLQITGIDGAIESSPGIYYSDDTIYDMDSLVFGVTPLGGSAVMRCGYSISRVKWLVFNCIIWGCIIFGSFAFVVFYTGANERSFILYSILISGLMFIMIEFPNPIDESTHFFRAMCISEGDIVDTIEDGEIGAYVADNYDYAIDNTVALDDVIFGESAYEEPLNDNEEFFVNPYMSSYNPLNHLVPAIGIMVARLFGGVSVYVIALAGRLANLLVYTTICYIAIKKAKYYKSLFFVVASLPLAQWLAVSISADPILNATSLLFVSICLKYYFYDEEDKEEIVIATHEIVMLLLCGLVIASTKYCIYCLVLLVFFLIPRKYFSKKKYAITLTMAIVIILVMFVTQIGLMQAFPFTEDRNGNVDTQLQLQYMAGHIGTTISVFTTYFSNIVLEHMSNMYLITSVEGFSRLLSLLIVASCLGIRDRYDFSNHTEGILKKKRLFAVSLIAFAGIYVLAAIAEYVGFTPVGKNTIDGYQARYVIPQMFFLMFMLSLLPVKIEDDKFEDKIVFMIVLATILQNVGNIVAALY